MMKAILGLLVLLVSTSAAAGDYDGLRKNVTYTNVLEWAQGEYHLSGSQVLLNAELRSEPSIHDWTLTTDELEMAVTLANAYCRYKISDQKRKVNPYRLKNNGSFPFIPAAFTINQHPSKELHATVASFKYQQAISSLDDSHFVMVAYYYENAPDQRNDTSKTETSMTKFLFAVYVNMNLGDADLHVRNNNALTLFMNERYPLLSREAKEIQILFEKQINQQEGSKQ